MIEMTTDGPGGFPDGLRGSTSERVLRKASVPAAILPVGSVLGWEPESGTTGQAGAHHG